MRATIRDVAREAGVSIATVSRVLNGSGPVREATRERVLAVATRLRYAPSSAARSLITRRTNTLGVLLPDLHGEFFSELIRGIDHVARSAGYHILVSTSHNRRTEIEVALQAMRGRVDGLIVMAPDRDVDELAALLATPLPTVLLNQRTLDGGPHNRINIDNAGGARTLVSHFIEQGHRRIALIGGPAANLDAAARRRGYRQALESAGLPLLGELEVSGEFTEAGGQEAAQRLLALQVRPTAVFAANDAMAIGALHAFVEAGVSIPADMSLAGFDDIPMARYLRPPLTSVRVPIQELGSRATARLLELLAGPVEDERWNVVLGTELVVRGSSGALRTVGADAVHA